VVKSKLINRKAYITDKESIYYNEWGIIKDFDGECYYIAIANGLESIPVFNRNQFQVSRKQEVNNK
jgi:hypothetical protein